LTSPHIRLAPEDIEAIAVAVVDTLESRQGRYVDAAELANDLGVSRDYIYENAGELGAVKLGGGRRPRLRFELAVARAAFVRLHEKPRPRRTGQRRRRALSSPPNQMAGQRANAPGPDIRR
jgi:hypothetical protein